MEERMASIKEIKQVLEKGYTDTSCGRRDQLLDLVWCFSHLPEPYQESLRDVQESAIRSMRGAVKMALEELEKFSQ